MRRWVAIIFTLVIVMSAACGIREITPSDNGPKVHTGELESESEKRCGDGVCDGPESVESCPQDCNDELPIPSDGQEMSDTESDAYWVENPTSGAQLYMEVLTPEGWNGEALPTLVLIPGGSGDSSHFTDKLQGTFRYLDAGYALVVFDPDGRGNSEGEENNNGYTHQDGLAAVVEYAAELPMVDSERMGITSYSYGITMASGTLARHPDLPLKFLVDWEGPANRDDTGGCDADKLGHLVGYGCDNEDFWREREASGFALKLKVPYLRLQSEEDHVQPDNYHALLMIANATHEQYGGHGQSPWTRLNNLDPNVVYEYDDPPPLMDESQGSDAFMVRVIEEMFEMWAE